MARHRTAALVVVGNEILSGKVVDTNSTFLSEQLRSLGVSLRRVLVIPDEIDAIASAIRDYQPNYDVVFTSGGVGPTHDDVTIAGVAKGLGRSVVRHPTLEAKLHEFFGADVNDARLKMTEVVAGTELVFEGNLSFPTLRVENIYILPGIPEIFREKFAAIREHFASDPFHLRIIYTRESESTIAVFLNRTLESFPDVLLGSYPTLNDPEYRVRITLESKNQQYVERAFEALRSMLPADTVVRIE